MTGVDPDGDLAVVSVDTAGARAIDWGAGDGLAVGAPVFGVAATFGGGVRVTFGLVSSVSRSFRGPGGRRIAGSVEHTAPLAPGSSGGAIVDAAGQVPGPEHEPDRRRLLPRPAGRRRACGRASTRWAGASRRSGCGWASRSRPRTSRGGCGGRSGSPSARASSSAASRNGSLAEAAGIEAGDLIVSAGGKPIADADDLFDALGGLEPPFEIGIVRGAEERTVTVAAPAEGGGKAERTPGDA